MNKISKFAGVFVAVAFAVAVATPASAMTTAELTALLKGLGVSDSVIASVTAAQGGSTVSTGTCGSFTKDLTLGSTGAEVVSLQDFLVAQGKLTIPAGVSKGYFGAMTQKALAAYQAANAISPAAGYFGPMTRAKVSAACGTTGSTGTGSTGSTGLKGGDGDIQNITKTTSGTETTLGEGKTEKVVGFDLEADDNSDLNVSSVKVQIGTEVAESSRLSKYLDGAAIMLGDEEVGSIDASDFSRDGATSTATISLKKAVVEAGEKGRFYVALTAADSINDSEIDASLNVDVTRVRVEDANGAVLTEDVSDVSTTVDFEDATANDDAKIKSSSDSRDAGLLKVDNNTSSDDYDLLTFKFDVDDNSSDLVVTELPVDLIVYNAATSSLNLESLVQDMWVEVDGQKYDDYAFETDHTVAATSTETVTSTLSIDEGDLTIAAGDVVDAVVYVKLSKQSGNYAEGTTIKASVVGSEMTTENPDGDSFAVSGTVTGETQTVQLSAAAVEGFSWSVNNTGNIVDFFFTVTAEDDDFTVLASSIASTTAGTATTSAGVLSFSSGDQPTVNSAGVSYTVSDGDTATFRIRYTLTGSNGTYKEITITSVAGQEVPSTKQVSPTATINIQS